MGFMRLTPENAAATRVALVGSFVLGGAVIFLAGATGAVLAALGIIAFRWEQAALAIIGAGVAGVGAVVRMKRPER